MSGTPSDEITPVPPELCIVRAGAGAGKTTELVRRVIGLAKHYLATQKRLPNLVVTTFTRKATQELKERLLSKVIELQDTKLLHFVQSSSHLHISTIHGVLGLYLMRFGRKLGLSPQLRIVDSSSELRMLKKAIRHILKTQPDLVGKMDQLLEEQNLKGLLQALQNYIQLRYSHSQKIAFFSKNDLKKLHQQELLGWLEKSEEFLGYVESTQTGKHWPEYLSLMKGAQQQIKNSQGQDFSLLLQYSLQRPTASLRGASEELKELKTEVQKLADRLTERLWLMQEETLNRHETLAQNFQEIAETLFQTIRQEKISSNQLSMADLENFSMWLAHDFPESAEHFSTEWDYWLVDEYQDTSPTQVQILNLLIGGRHSFTVGDPQQSIYLFRGARSEVFLQKERSLENQGGQLFQKMENYRSRPELLHFLNHFFHEFDSSQFRPMLPTQKAEQPEEKNKVCAFFIHADEKLEQAEYLCAIERIRSLRTEGVAAEEICVLARSNQSLQDLAQLCFQFQVPVQIHSGSSFRNRREILDALLLLKFLINPFDNVNLLGLLRTPWFRIHDQDLQVIANIDANINEQKSYWQHLLDRFVENFVTQQLQTLKAYAEQVGFVQAWYRGIVECGIIDFCNRLDPSGRREANLMKLLCELRQKERLPGFRLLDLIYQFETNGVTQLDTETGGETDAVPVICPQRVNLMTVHAAKGLQFQHVILIGVGNKVPNSKSSFFMYDEQDCKSTLSLVETSTGKMQATVAGENIRRDKAEREKQESARVLYVALTRAKSSVSLIWQKEPQGSWAAKMWKPAEGVTDHKLFQTSFCKAQRPDVLQLTAENPLPPLLKPKVELPLSVITKAKSVTQLLENAKTQGRFKNPQQSSQMRMEKVQRGIEIHRIFETLQFRQTPPPSLQNENEKLIYHFLQTENGQHVRTWIEHGFVEWGFCVALQGQSYQGQIDLWVRLEKSAAASNAEVIIVDYKTGSQDNLSKAQEQLKIYAWALRRMRKIQDNDLVKIAVVYPFEGQIIMKQLNVAELEHAPF